MAGCVPHFGLRYSRVDQVDGTSLPDGRGTWWGGTRTAKSAPPGPQARAPALHGQGYGLVFAISGRTSPSFLAMPARWCLVRPSRRNSNPCSGESAILKSSRSAAAIVPASIMARSEEHTSELQSRLHLVC